MDLSFIPTIDQSWTIEDIANTEDAIPASWRDVFHDAHDELVSISEVIESDEVNNNNSCLPLKKDIFNAFWCTPLEDVNVVIVGQDPYPQMVGSVPRATGLSFSVRRNDTIPSSLQNIFKELQRSQVYGFSRSPSHGDLTNWASQGVLLLNSCLTVRPGRPGSHGIIWSGFISRVLTAIAEVNPQCIFVLWGKEAQKIKQLTGWSGSFLTLEAAHPSGLSARNFFNCNHFNLVNQMLVDLEKPTIDWNLY